MKPSTKVVKYLLGCIPPGMKLVVQDNEFQTGYDQSADRKKAWFDIGVGGGKVVRVTVEERP